MSEFVTVAIALLLLCQEDEEETDEYLPEEQVGAAVSLEKYRASSPNVSPMIMSAEDGQTSRYDRAGSLEPPVLPQVQRASLYL